MSKNFQLQIPVPCHEDWNKMTTGDQGRFCLSCQKTVVDFSSMTDSEIILYFKNAKGNTCGRFTDDQLNRKYQVESKKRLNWFKYFLQILVPTLLFTTRSYSQGVIKSKPAVCATPNKKTNKEDRVYFGGIAFVRSESIIRGKITDNEGRILPAASIMINGTTEGTSSDEEGNFYFKTTREFPIRISVSYVGYETSEILVDEKRAAKPLNVVLNEKLLEKVVVICYPSTKGKVAITGSVSVFTDSVITTKRIFHNFTKVITDSVKTAFGNASMKMRMYPNPISLSSLLTIEFPIKKDGDYKIEIFDISGRLIKAEVITMHAPLLQRQIRLNQAMAAGTYLVALSDPNGKRVATQKLIAK